MFQRGWFQIDVKRQELLPELLGVVHQYGPARVKPLSGEVIAELARDGRFAAVIVQHGDATLATIDRVHAEVPGLPVLALLEQHEASQLNALSARGVSTMLLPLSGANVVHFVQRSLTHSFVPSTRVGALIVQLAQTRMLTAREVQLISYCLGDEPRSRVRRRLGITENTLKSQIRGLLRKCGERNLDALAKNVLRSALAPAGASHGVSSTASAAGRAQPAATFLPGTLHELAAHSASSELSMSGHSEITRPALRVYSSARAS